MKTIDFDGRDYKKLDYNTLSDLEKKYLWEAVKRNGYAIQYIKNPSEAVQMEAVKRNGYAIQHIANPSEVIKEISTMHFVEKFEYFCQNKQK